MLGVGIISSGLRFCNRCGNLASSYPSGDKIFYYCNVCRELFIEDRWDVLWPIVRYLNREKLVLEHEIERVKEENPYEFRGDVVDVFERDFYDVYRIEFSYGYSTAMLKYGDVIVCLKDKTPIGYGVITFSIINSDVVDVYVGFRKDVEIDLREEYVFKYASEEFLIQKQLELINELEDDPGRYPNLVKLLNGDGCVSVPSDYRGDPINTAIKLALALNEGEYFIIHGPPGCGKTQTIAEVAYSLAKKGYRILITGHTNIAVDNALERIIRLHSDAASTVCKIGHPVKTLKSIRHLLSDARGKSRYDIEPYNIIGATLTMVGILHEMELLRDIKFDYIIVDEASMAMPSLTLLALRHGKRFILVGDHKQLPPIVKCKMSERL